MKPQTISLSNGENLRIREAQVKDAKQVIDYVKIVADETHFLTFNSREFNFTVKEEQKIIRDSHNLDNQIFLIAIIKDKIVGMLNVWSSQRERLKHQGEFGISVLEEHWGKGIGTYLITTLLDWAKRSKIITKINLGVQEDNYNAIALYKKLGFTEEGRISRGSRIGETYFDVIRMGIITE